MSYELVTVLHEQRVVIVNDENGKSMTCARRSWERIQNNNYFIINGYTFYKQLMN